MHSYRSKHRRVCNPDYCDPLIGGWAAEGIENGDIVDVARHNNNTDDVVYSDKDNSIDDYNNDDFIDDNNNEGVVVLYVPSLKTRLHLLLTLHATPVMIHINNSQQSLQQTTEQRQPKKKKSKRSKTVSETVSPETADAAVLVTTDKKSSSSSSTKKRNISKIDEVSSNELLSHDPSSNKELSTEETGSESMIHTVSDPLAVTTVRSHDVVLSTM
eukprot:12433-Heterococcus_DN1.PRE.4